MEDLSNQDLNALEPKKANPFIALLLNLLFFGSGHVYLGRLKIGIIYSLSFIIITTLVFTNIVSYFWGYLGIIILFLILAITSHIHVVISAKKLKTIERNKFNSPAFLAVYSIAFFLISSIISAFFPEMITFKVYTSANEPTFKVKDRLLIDKNINSPEDLKTGDFIVFAFRDQYLLSSVVGLPGDQVEIIDGDLFINGQKCALGEKKKYTDDPDYGDALTIGEETYPNGVKHNIIRNINFRKFAAIQTNPVAINKMKVPANCFFVLGDNRENSMDSRYIGPVEFKSVIGKIRGILWR